MCQQNERKVGGRELVVASGDPTAVLDLVEEPFHQIVHTI
jgi:hypothetical protein